METREKIRRIQKELEKIDLEELRLMEVCGTHTMSIAASGIVGLLPPWIRLISGPGCPVCVTPQSDIALALDLAGREDTLIATFGDMVRIPCRGDRLENHGNVRILYSPADALKLADGNRDKEIVFIAVGFETTAPLIGATVLEAEKAGIGNFSVLCLHKTIPAALKLILSDRENTIDGLILPGHVAAVTGAEYFHFLRESATASVITGFEALDILESIYLHARMAARGEPELINNYKRAVTSEGNGNVRNIMNEVFEPCSSQWRGIGSIDNSGLKIREKYGEFDCFRKFPLEREEIPDPEGCLCGAILTGKNNPSQCIHFGKNCTPADPIGPCMVSSEGTCAAWFKYGKGD